MIAATPNAVIAGIGIRVVANRVADFRNHSFRIISVGCKNQLGDPPEPASVRNEPIYPDRLAPRGIIKPAIFGGTGLLDDEPAVSGDDAAPTYRPRREDADNRPDLGERGWQQPGTGPIRILPVNNAIPPKIKGRREDWRQYEQPKKYEEKVGHVGKNLYGRGLSS
jgi:hypothetical protein